MQHRIEKSAVVIEKRSAAQSENQPIEISADSISNEDGLVSAEGNVTIQTPQGIFKSNAIQIIPAKAK
jgi:adhesin HecA-like repeat protein